MKLTDGDNVWWKVWRNFRPSTEWQEVVIPAGEIGFAWGPATDKMLRHADGVEVVVARNRDGGERQPGAFGQPLDHRGAAEVVLEAADQSHVGAAPTVNRLVVVANDNDGSGITSTVSFTFA